jgi:hypothetical protein
MINFARSELRIFHCGQQSEKASISYAVGEGKVQTVAYLFTLSLTERRMVLKWAII